MSPRDVLASVLDGGIEIAAITDHETASGYLEIADEVPEGTQLIFGVEFSTHHQDSAVVKNGTCEQEKPGAAREIHILGYFPGGVTESIQLFLKELQQERINRAKVALVNLRKKGCRISYDQLMEHVRGDCISRAHMSRALIANGLVSSTYEAFNRYLDISHGIVPTPLLSPKRAITFINSKGGIPVWAHPNIDAFDLLVKEFVEYGLKGVEICSHKRAESYSFYFERTARVLKLFVTYGSDWHGFPDEKLKGITVPRENIDDFLEIFRD